VPRRRVFPSDVQAEFDDFDAELKLHEGTDTPPPSRAEQAEGRDPDATPTT
jgi:hypothetical protein